MIRPVGVGLLGVLLLAGCGKKGPPLAPLVVVPQRVTEISALRRGEHVDISFVIPDRDSTGASPGDIRFVEVYALTGMPVDRVGRQLDDRTFRRHATLVARLEVEPPPEPPEAGDTELPGARPEDPRPAQGERITVGENLTPETRIPVVIDEAAPRRSGREREEVAPPQPLSWPPASTVLERYYTAVALGRRRGTLGELVAVPLGDVPPRAGGPEVTYTETAATLAWPVPPAAHVAMFAPAAEGDLSPRLVLRGSTPHTYNVYAWDGEASDAPSGLSPLNPTPLDTTSMALPGLVFGVQRCFAVRVAERVGQAMVEGDMSPPTCITPVDGFPPEAPRGLAAVGSEGGISLIWNANTEPDLEGYVILRGPAPDAPTEALTPTPIKETTFRDITAPPGERLAYVVIAVDRTGNRSRPSNQVEDAAR